MRYGNSSGARMATPPTVLPSTIHRSETNGLYDITRCASVPPPTGMSIFKAVTMGGETLSGRSAAAILRAGVTQVPQSQALFPHMSVRENVLMGGFLIRRDKKLLANAPYAQAVIPEPYRRHIVNYHRKETAGTIVVDSDARYLYYVLEGGKAIRYGITVGEEAMAWSGIAKIGSKTEWPPWHPTKSEISRLGVPTYVAPGPDNPMGSRALYLYSGGKDTLFRIHGTNQPEYIGASISSGCIRLTNEDVIDLYDRVGLNMVVVVLEPKHGDSPFNSALALQGGGANVQ